MNCSLALSHYISHTHVHKLTHSMGGMSPALGQGTQGTSLYSTNPGINY